MKPRLLDLFCGAGGASMGYHRAGFEVVGVDSSPMPRYPFEFHQGDALDFYDSHGHEFDVIHASPPCQDHSPLSARAGKHGTGWLLSAISGRLRSSDRLYVVENVAGASMPVSLLLCGSMFGLRTYRHRKFEIAMCAGMLIAPAHPRHRAKVATRDRVNAWANGFHMSVTGDIGVTVAGPALGVDWMNGEELSQAIPPAYTQFIGEQLIDQLTRIGATA